MKKTKIVATIGPASNSKETLKQMISAGMNVARINFSHGTHDSNGQVIDIIKELRRELNLPIGIMADLQGPRIRTLVDGEVEIQAKEIIYILDSSLPPNFQFPISNFKKISNDKISKKLIRLDYENIIKGIEEGNEILIEDGLIKIKVVEKKEDILLGEVFEGGTVKNHKGVNIPGAKLDIPILTEKDEKDLTFALSKDADFVALSFVSNRKEIEEVREKIRKISGREVDLPQIVSKIERKEAMENIDEIVEASDAVMVARGDLGIELPESKVAVYQKEIVAKCLEKIRPVIVATQMLNSMIENPLPTRAEVSDVSNAVIDHADAVMLSGESADGKFPVKAVETMNQIILDTEESKFDDFVPHYSEEKIFSDMGPIVSGAWKLAKSEEARAIFLVSRSGFTARFMSNFRPERALFCATGSQKVYNQLSLAWGAEPYFFDSGKIEEYINLAISKAKKEKKLKTGDKVVVISGGISRGKKMRSVGIREI